MRRVDRLLQQRAEHVLAVHLAVGQFAADHLQFALELRRLELHPLHRVGHQANRRQHVLGRTIDIEDRSCRWRWRRSITPPKHGDDLFDLLLGVPRGRAAGNDVLQHVAHARPEVRSLVGAAGILHKATHGGHRRGMILLDQHRQPVAESGQGRVARQSLDAGVNGRLDGCGGRRTGSGDRRRRRLETPRRERSRAIRPPADKRRVLILFSSVPGVGPEDSRLGNLALFSHILRHFASVTGTRQTRHPAALLKVDAAICRAIEAVIFRQVA